MIQVRLSPLLAGVLGALALAACTPAADKTGGAPADTSAETKVVNVYSSRHYDSDTAVFAAFKEKTGIDVRVVQAEGNQLLERLKAEGEYANADLVITVDAGNLDRLVEANLLQPVRTPALDATPAQFREADGRWYGFLKRARVIVYAKGKVDPVSIASMDALAGPAMKGKVCARTSTNLYNLSLMAARIEREGPEKALAWARGVVGNFARDPQGSDSDQLRAVAAGQCQAAIANHYYLIRFRRSQDPADRAIAEKLDVVIPDQAGAGAHVNISGVGLAAYAKNRANAIALMEYLAGPEAQAIMSEKNNELPVAAGVTLTPELAALGAIREERVDYSTFGARQPEAQRLFDEAGWK